MEIMRLGGVKNTRERQIEIPMIGGNAGKAGRHDRSAVIAVMAGDDLLFRRLADRVVVEPHEVDQEIVGFGSGKREVDFRIPDRHQCSKALGQIDRRIDRFVGHCVIVGQFVKLFGCGFDELGLIEAEQCAPHPRRAFDIGGTVLVIDINALAACDYGRPAFTLVPEFDITMQEMTHVSCSSGIFKHCKSSERCFVSAFICSELF